MIGVLTSNFVLYYDLLRALQRRNTPFVSLTFDQEVPAEVGVVITAEEDREAVSFGKLICAVPGQDIDEVIDRALFALYRSRPFPEVVIGIDPGATPGIALFGEGRLLRRFTASSPPAAVACIRSFISNWQDCRITVRIGHGARLIRNRIINLLWDDVTRIEIVNETSTTPPNTHDDTMAAAAIALTPGRQVLTPLSVDPKDGEIRDVQRKSRMLSGDVTISRSLARKVLTGEMEMDEAVEAQRHK
ncbi:MAG: hypothetical protein PHU95_02860 [Candidatus Thermoplasmatota archaeon]|nr:hypothetical protein [Candidatus Thermoplasmatota archaeon]